MAIFIDVSYILTIVTKMLTTLFTSTARVKILNKLLFSSKSFHLRELARETGVSPPQTSKELSKLKKAGIVREERLGNLCLFSMDPSSPILTDLKNLFIKTDYLGGFLREKLEGKAKFVLIYGSFARGEEKTGSDIDLLIVSEIKEDKLLPIVRHLEEETSRELNYILWDDKAFSKRKGSALLKTMLKSGVLMIIGDEDEFRKEAL